MVSTRKFYRTTIIVEVLSEEYFDADTLSEVARAIEDGNCSGEWTITSQNEVTGPEMAKLLREQHSEPGFFQLDGDGNDEE